MSPGSERAGRVRLRAGILAAGRGERFRRAGHERPKPLVEVAGRTLLDRAIRSAADAGAQEVAIIVHDRSPELLSAVRRGPWPLPVEVVVRRTASSMESLFVLGELLRGAPFLLLTVDAILRPGALAGLAAAGASHGPAGVLGVTRFVDDEKPLHARLDERGEITALGDAAAGGGWVTSGVYLFHPEVLDAAPEARRRRLGALRQFLALVLEQGGRLGAFDVGTSVDVDRPHDVEVAERFLEESGG